MVECNLPKVNMRVRFPLSAPCVYYPWEIKGFYFVQNILKKLIKNTKSIDFCKSHDMLKLWLSFGYPCGPKPFYYIGVDVMKKFKTYQEQIELLKTRGLIIDDEQFVLQQFQRISNLDKPFLKMLVFL